MNSTNISIVIVTYQREQVLLDTLDSIFQQTVRADEVIVVDQSASHTDVVERQLQQWQADGKINWLHLDKPSIPAAMNRGAAYVSSDWILYLDDDVLLAKNFIECWLQQKNKHMPLEDDAVEQAFDEAQNNRNMAVIAGRVIQPWDDEFNHRELRCQLLGLENTSYFMGGNCLVNRSALKAVGGFDENFMDVAYRFENELADRMLQKGFRLMYQPGIFIWHIKNNDGGTRSYGHHLTTLSSSHSFGAYYYLLKSQRIDDKIYQIAKRFIRAPMTSFHLKKPWYIPITCIAELRGLVRAIQLNRKNK